MPVGKHACVKQRCAVHLKILQLESVVVSSNSTAVKAGKTPGVALTRMTNMQARSANSDVENRARIVSQTVALRFVCMVA